jgi:hypothetical protein
VRYGFTSLKLRSVPVLESSRNPKSSPWGPKSTATSPVAGPAVIPIKPSIYKPAQRADVGFVHDHAAFVVGEPKDKFVFLILADTNGFLADALDLELFFDRQVGPQAGN